MQSYYDILWLSLPCFIINMHEAVHWEYIMVFLVVSLLGMILPIIQTWRICDEEYTFQRCERHTVGKLRNPPEMNYYIPQIYNEMIQVLQKGRMHAVIEVGFNLFMLCFLYALTAECSGKESIVAPSHLWSQNTRKNKKSIFHLCSNVTQQALSVDWTNNLPSSLQNKEPLVNLFAWNTI